MAKNVVDYDSKAMNGPRHMLVFYMTGKLCIFVKK